MVNWLIFLKSKEGNLVLYLNLLSYEFVIYFWFQQEIQSLREKLRKQKSSTDVVAAEQVKTRNVVVTEKVWSVICSPQDMFKYLYLVY